MILRWILFLGRKGPSCLGARFIFSVSSLNSHPPTLIVVTGEAPHTPLNWLGRGRV